MLSLIPRGQVSVLSGPSGCYLMNWEGDSTFNCVTVYITNYQLLIEQPMEGTILWGWEPKPFSLNSTDAQLFHTVPLNNSYVKLLKIRDEVKILQHFSQIWPQDKLCVAREV